jgi:cytoskeleton protein RodZ
MEQSENQLQLDEMGTIGPGRFLLHARQNKKLRIEDVAFELRLTPSQVTALEEDDYSRMPEVTYVRGYLRNYARLLGLSPDEILLAHSRITRNDDHTTMAVAPIGEREIHATGMGIKLLGTLILLAVIGAAAYWYLGREAVQPVAEDKPQPTAPVAAEVPTGASKLSFVEPAVPVSPPELPATPSSIEKTAIQDAPAPTAGESTALPETAAQAGVAAGAAQTSAAAGMPSETPVSAPAGAAGPGQLVINYKKSCWTDIRDAKGRKLVYRTVPAGETLRVEGETPFTLFFGFAVGVDLQFNGKPVDLKEHTRGVFARLTLDN